MSGKKRKEMVPVIVVILLIVLVGCVGALTAVIKRMTPSDEDGRSHLLWADFG